VWESEINVVGRPVLAADRRRRAGVGSMLGRLAGKGEERLGGRATFEASVEVGRLRGLCRFLEMLKHTGVCKRYFKSGLDDLSLFYPPAKALRDEKTSSRLIPSRRAHLVRQTVGSSADESSGAYRLG